nr:uncharacterized protein LOC106682383 [Halyomorpha halys]
MAGNEERSLKIPETLTVGEERSRPSMVNEEILTMAKPQKKTKQQEPKSKKEPPVARYHDAAPAPMPLKGSENPICQGRNMTEDSSEDEEVYRLVPGPSEDYPETTLLCLRCQKYGHPAKACTEDQACKWCLGTEHKIKECPAKKKALTPRCRNCSEQGREGKDLQHCAGIRECPLHLEKMVVQTKRTRYA